MSAEFPCHRTGRFRSRVLAERGRGPLGAGTEVFHVVWYGFVVAGAGCAPGPRA